MSEQETPPRPLVRAVRTAAIAALIAALAYQAVGAAVFLPRLSSDDPHKVVTAYYTAQRWGFRSVAEQALDPDLREERRSSGFLRGLRDDALLSGDLEVSAPADIELYGENAEEFQMVVTYRSVWTDEVGSAPGKRIWFVYVGRDPGEPWQLLSMGTGP